MGKWTQRHLEAHLGNAGAAVGAAGKGAAAAGVTEAGRAAATAGWVKEVAATEVAGGEGAWVAGRGACTMRGTETSDVGSKGSVLLTHDERDGDLRRREQRERVVNTR